MLPVLPRAGELEQSKTSSPDHGRDGTLPERLRTMQDGYGQSELCDWLPTRNVTCAGVGDEAEAAAPS